MTFRSTTGQFRWRPHTVACNDREERNMARRIQDRIKGVNKVHLALNSRRTITDRKDVAKLARRTSQPQSQSDLIYLSERPIRTRVDCPIVAMARLRKKRETQCRPRR